MFGFKLVIIITPFISSLTRFRGAMNRRGMLCGLGRVCPAAALGAIHQQIDNFIVYFHPLCVGRGKISLPPFLGRRKTSLTWNTLREKTFLVLPALIFKTATVKRKSLLILQLKLFLNQIGRQIA